MGIVDRTAAVLLVLSLVGRSVADGPWQDPWITVDKSDPYIQSFTPDTGTVEIFEDIPADHQIAVLHATAGSTITTDKNQLQFNQTDETSTEYKAILKIPLDYESSTTVSIYIKVNGGYGQFLLIDVLNVNDNIPQFKGIVSQVTLDVPENHKNDSLLTLTATDGDTGSTPKLTYKLDDTESGLFELVQLPDPKQPRCRLRLNTTLDFEKTQLYQLSVTVTDVADSKGTVHHTSVTIFVNVKDEGDTPPRWLHSPPSVTISETDAKKGKVLFNVSAIDGDTGVNNAIVYSILQQSLNDTVEINSTTGEVQLLTDLDREDPKVKNLQGFITVTIQAQEKDQKCSEITCRHDDSLIEVADADDNPPKLDKPKYETTVLEGSSGQLGLQINVTDPDSHYPNGAFQLTLKDAPDDVFKVTMPKGVSSLITDISVTNSDYLDYEKFDNISFQIVATGDNINKFSSTADITVLLTDKNDEHPVFEHSSYPVNITEDYASGHDIITVNATDADRSDEFGTKSIRFSLSGGKQSAIEIDSKTGHITVVNQPTPPFDYDAGDRFFNYTIKAQDCDGTGNSALAYLILNIGDINDTPPKLQSPPNLDVAENDKNAVITADITATDDDTDAQLHFSIDWHATSGTKDGKTVDPSIYNKSMEISPVSGARGTSETAQLTTTSVILDREKVDTVQMSIVIEDTKTETGKRSASSMVTINVLDINDNNPYFTNINSSTSIKVTENWPIHVPIAIIMAQDDDQNNTITYSIEGEEKYTSLVDIDPTTGQLTVADTIDREKIPEIELTFRATDSGVPPRSTALKMNLEVEDQNDCVPVWVVDPINMTVYVLEGPTTHAVIAQISATDDDKPNTPASTITYSLTGEGRQNVTIDANTGELRVKGTLDREQLAYTSSVLTVRVDAGDECDGTNCFHIIHGYLRIQVNDTNDNPPVLPPNTGDPIVDIEEKKPADSDVGSVQGTDADKAGTPAATLSFSLGPMVAKRSGCNRTDLFTVRTEQNTAKLSSKGSLQDCWGEYTINITASDGEDPFHHTSQMYDARISDVNDPPVFVSPEDGFSFSIKENSYNGTVARLPVVVNGKTVVVHADDPDDTLLPNSKITYNLLQSSTPSTATTTFAVEPSDGTLFLTGKVDRESKLGYEFILQIEARDQGAGGGLTDTLSLNVTISDVDEYVPTFADRQNDDTRFTENQTIGADIQTVTSQATDRDDTDHIFYFIVGGAREVFALVNSSGDPQLKTLQTLDREQHSEYQLILQTTSTDDQPEIVDHFDPDNDHQLNMTIIVQDINDNPPHLEGNFMAGVAEGDKKAISLTTITATDPDLNDTTTYTITGNFTTEDDSLKSIIDITVPFLLDSSSGELKLNFDVDKNMEGWIDFQVTATDKKDHSDTKPVRVFIITADDRVRFVFKNPTAIVTSQKKQVADILTQVFKFTANIETIIQSKDIPQSTDVVAHFIDLTKPAPVLGSIIVNDQYEGDTSKQLINKFQALALNLTHIDDGSVKKPADKDTVFQMLLIVTASVLGGILAITLITACLQVKKLRRQVRALSINAFGSRDSGMQKVGLTVPGSNVYANQGANPVFTMDENAGRAADAESQSSGDSVLIGVEDDPEFRGYHPHKRPAPSAPAGDDIAPAVFDETMRMPQFEVDDDDGFAEPPFPGAAAGVSQNPLFGADLGDGE